MAAHFHERAGAIVASVGIAVIHGDLGPSTWQQIILCDFDDRQRDREVIVTLYGD